MYVNTLRLKRKGKHSVPLKSLINEMRERNGMSPLITGIFRNWHEMILLSQTKLVHILVLYAINSRDLDNAIIKFKLSLDKRLLIPKAPTWFYLKK